MTLRHFPARKPADAMKEQIRKKDDSLVGNMKSEGTTPREASRPLLAAFAI